jgi:hypothetical protein
MRDLSDQEDEAKSAGYTTRQDMLAARRHARSFRGAYYCLYCGSGDVNPRCPFHGGDEEEEL